jgi:DNA polymerase I-like protein with 3'-5' exonuclease and polymerase domains
MPAIAIATKRGAKVLTYEFWNGQRLRSRRQCPLAFDTETTWITDERKIPTLALAVASDGRDHLVIHPERLAEFLLEHEEGFFVGHNVQFDFWVVDQYLEERGESAARRVLWSACDQGRLFDTLILDLLLQLAKNQFRHGGEKVYPGNLADVAADYTCLSVNKADAYRQRFGELVGLSFEDLAGVEPGFFEYAVRDAIVTQRLYPALGDAAYKLMVTNGYDSKAERYNIRPDALAKFGYLSEVLQVKASIVLASMLRRGVRVDLQQAQALEAKYRSEMAAIITTLESDYREVLEYGKDGQLRLTPTGKTPSLPTGKLSELLLKVIQELEAQGHEVQVPMSDGKKRGMSHSVKAWGRYAELHPFLKLWCSMSQLAKLLEFFAHFTAPVLHCEYSLLTRTGRTSCSAPRSKELPGVNLQQMPRQAEFRALFIPSPGQKLFIGDFAAVELRTLAAVCKARYGHSRLGEVIIEGTDPHAFTAAAVQGMDFACFMAMKATDPKGFKEARQAAKAINFGVPGGLGSKTLKDYARANYGVTLTQEEAAAFKKTLITDVYPELNDQDGYLADNSMAVLARNIGVKEREAWEIFDRSGQRNPIAARGVANVISGKSKASERYQATVWEGLRRLAQTVSHHDAAVAEMIAGHRGCQQLHDALYWQSAATLTGRIRSGVNYTECRNTPFQSLAADGAKLALWNLLYAGFDVYGFIHDEILVELPPEGAEEKAKEIEQIMVSSLEEVMGQGIPAACEYSVAECWTKK